ncbi:hypothetical protein LCGC14_3143600 [marine sediment metagenome]|uniref:Uncharacterized protein n=1 Tax=marine sediment metagenome TaxID=412755 RepID=A0A0F8Y322_9ZZZZ
MKTQIYIWGNRRFEVCKIPKNKKKVGFLGVLAIPFILTLGTNWLYLLGVNVLFRIKPLWIFQ